MTQTRNEIAILPGMSGLVPRYDAWLVDIWGVMHNGVRHFRRAVEACARFRGAGGTVVLVTNAPRPWPSVQAQLDRLEITRHAYDDIVTSGDVTRQLLADVAAEPIHHLGPERDKPLFDGLGLRLVAAEEAAHIVCTGLFDDTRETPEDYRTGFAAHVARGASMICANPDIKVERGDSIIYCAGALAALYVELGGRVAYAGKPYPAIYQRALAIAGRRRKDGLAPERVLAIGDGLHTDIAGACQAGLDAVFVPSGVHVAGGRAFDDALIGELFAGREHTVVAALPELGW